MNTVKRYLRLYRVLVAQFLKTIMQSRVDFLIGLLGFFFTQVMGIADSGFAGLDARPVDFYLWFCADSAGD